MGLAARRRRRRPPLLVVAVVLSILVLGVNAAYSARSPGPARRLADLAWLDDVRPLVQRSTAQASDVVDLREHASGLARDVLDRRLERLAGEAFAIQRTVTAAKPPVRLRVPSGLLVATLALRARAADAIRSALSGTLAAAPVDAATLQLVGAGQDMAAADRTYTLFLSSLPPEVSADKTAMPPSMWVADPKTWQLEQLGGFVSSVRSSTSLAPVHDVVIMLVTLSPTPVGVEGEASVLPASSNLRIDVVVQNAGNETERKVPLVASLQPGDSSQTVIDVLAPGQRRVVSLPPVHPQRGQSGTLTVRLGPVPSEASTGDNDRSVLFVVR